MKEEILHKSMEEKCNEDFEKIYDQVNLDCSSELKSLNRKNNCILIIAIILLCLYAKYKQPFKQEMYLILEFISFSMLIIFMLFLIFKKIYTIKFKTTIIKSIIESYNKNFNYYSKKGIDRLTYINAQFDKDFNEYISEDLITGPLRSGMNVSMSESATYLVRKYYDANNELREEKLETFRGAFLVVDLDKEIEEPIYLKINKNSKKYDKNRMEMESEVFEKYFDLMSKDKITALRLFTSDIIEFLANVRCSKPKDYFEIVIKNKKLYLRYKLGTMFEPPMFGHGLDKKNMYSYYKSIYYPMEVAERITESINNNL